MKANIAKTLLISAVVLSFASCSRRVGESVIATSSSHREIVQKSNAARNGLAQVSARLSLDLAMGTQDVHVGGDLKMKRNSLIQITLQALGLVTVGRMEFTPEYVMVMDNINKRYVRVPYVDVDFLRDNQIDFYTFQALLWGELFTPGQKDAAPQADSFQTELQGSDLLLTHQGTRLALSFLVAAASGQLRHTTVLGQQHGNGLQCAYLNWSNFGDKSFPNKLQISAKTGLQQDVVVDLSLSRLREDTSWKGIPTQVDETKFQQLTLKQVWNALMSLAR